ncbi:hypothetical protein [uncultured Chryseobacterium sp.]|uniref:hypothetical protein n=1 Tax=uncultured Chryseobacterium sp. TaxID=259322 RepID=UPI0026178841|nr:hypothetical protein [uncultured Chryseobacterium sp.]
MENPVEAWVWSEMDNGRNSLNAGHTPNNPSGKAAKEEESKTKGKYDEFWKNMISEIMKYLNH